MLIHFCSRKKIQKYGPVLFDSPYINPCTDHLWSIYNKPTPLAAFLNWKLNNQQWPLMTKRQWPIKIPKDLAQKNLWPRIASPKFYQYVLNYEGKEAFRGKLKKWPLRTSRWPLTPNSWTHPLSPHLMIIPSIRKINQGIFEKHFLIVDWYTDWYTNTRIGIP